MNAPSGTAGSAVPPGHGGIEYRAFLAELSRKRRVRRYLEIGVREGLLFAAVSAEVAVGVDPEFVLSANVAASKRRAALLQVTSDEFFADPTSTALLGGPPDLVVLDGMHSFEFLLRDFAGAESLAGRGTVVAMHDCLPLAAPMMNRSMGEAFRLGEGTPFHTWWTGDVWKMVPILRRYRPDLRVVALDCPPTGLVCVTGLDPANGELRRRYLEIVDAFRDLPNDEAALEELYGSLSLTSSSAVLNGLDHSLYFAT